MLWTQIKNSWTLIIPKSWHFTVLVEAHDKSGHQGVNRTHHLIKWQYYWKGMKNNIKKNITHCALYKWEKVRTQLYPLQMTDIPDRPFHKVAIELVSDLNVSHIRISTYTDYHWSFNRMARGFSNPWQESRHHCSCILINNYLPIQMYPYCHTVWQLGTEFKNQLMDSILQQLDIDHIFSAPCITTQSNGKLEVFHKYLKPDS